MNTKTKIAAIVAVVLLIIAGGIVFAQSSGNGNQKPPYNLDENYPGPYGPCGDGGYGGGYGGGCCGRW
jgi:hypothetical protein